MPHFCGRRHTRRREHEQAASINGPEGVAGETGAPTQDEIARLAYTYWERRGGPAGSPWEDWFRAERELKGTEGKKS